jgi:hypothetical protein
MAGLAFALLNKLFIIAASSSDTPARFSVLFLGTGAFELRNVIIAFRLLNKHKLNICQRLIFTEKKKRLGLKNPTSSYFSDYSQGRKLFF